MTILKGFILTWAVLFIIVLFRQTNSGKARSTMKTKKANKVLLSGLAVTIIATLLPILLPAISNTLGGFDYEWLDDGVITLREVVAFVAAIVIAVAKEVREIILRALGLLPDSN